MEIVLALKSKVVFYSVIILFFISGFIYDKTVKSIKFSLSIEEKLTNFETWEMIKNEKRKGNKKALIAFFAYCINTSCLFLMGGLICLMTI